MRYYLYINYSSSSNQKNDCSIVSRESLLEEYGWMVDMEENDKKVCDFLNFDMCSGLKINK